MSGTLVLGIGNTLLGDEGAGVHALQALRDAAKHLSDVSFLDGGTLSFTLAPQIERADHLLVLDAAELAQPAGGVRVFEDAAMDRFLGGSRRRSVHEVGLLDLLAVAQLTGSLPARRALIGIQPQYLDWSDRPGPAVQAAIPEVCRLAVALIRRWQDYPPQRSLA